MKLTAHIDYIENVERAGKLTLTSEDGTTFLSKVPVAIPDSLYNNPTFQKIHSTKSIQIQTDNQLLSFDKNGYYKDAFETLTQNNSEALFIKGIGKILFSPSNDLKLRNDESAFIMHKNDFKVLFDAIADKKNQVEIETEKVGFLWFPEKVTHAKGNINLVVTNFENIETKVKNAKEDVERISALEAAQKKAKINANNKPKLSDAVKNISSIIEQESKPKVTQPAKTQFQKNQNVIQAVPQRTSTTTTYGTNDDVDILDILLMYNNPDLAPFIRPNSSLAWFMYFNHRDNDINKTYVEQNIQNVQGFENVGSSDFKYTPKGYSVTLFEDEQKNSPVGRIEFDNQRNCYEVVSNNGEKTLLSVGQNGQLQSCFTSSTGSQTNMNLVQTNNGFVGNWESDNNGVKVNSGISFNNDFSYTSTPNESVDLSRVQPYTSTQNQGFDNIVQSVDNSYTKGYEPPPPPPKKDDVWSSSDPYSNSSSFKM